MIFLAITLSKSALLNQFNQIIKISAEGAMDMLREIVGGPKNRYKDEKFNLDLTYITPRLIAMAFPASGLEKLYRNSVDSVKEFLEQQHGKGYMIINLSGREVDESKLLNVYTYDWDDHQAPPIEMLFSICDVASQFLASAEQHVIAVHCNHGKGRTGTIVCCMLMYCNIIRDSTIAMDFYAKKRFEKDEGYGVTQPCQIQYIRYFEQIIKNPKLRPKVVALSRIVFRGETKHELLYVKLKTFTGKNIVTTKKYETNTAFNKNKNSENVQQLVLTLMEDAYFWGDVKMFIKTPSTLAPITVAMYSFNTAFIEGDRQVIRVEELSPYALRKTDNFSKDFQIQLQFKYGCACLGEMDFSKKCKKCHLRLEEEELKWNRMQEIIGKRNSLPQQVKEKMLGFAQKPIEKTKPNPYEINLQ